jgi:hypothetical protein
VGIPALRELPPVMRPQYLHGVFVEGDDPAAGGGLGIALDDLVAGGGAVTFEAQHTAVEVDVDVDVDSAQAADLTAA